MVFILMAIFCNAFLTVMRVADDNELGLHHYIRVAGVSAPTYWASHVIAIAIHMILQSLLLALLLGIPTNAQLIDPMHDTSLTMRTAILFVYSMAINTHGVFVGSMFSKTTHALMVTSLLAVFYCMYPITQLLQWNPYEYTSFYPLQKLALASCASCFEALVIVMVGVSMQLGKPIDWTHLGESIIGNGSQLTELSIGTLFIVLCGHIVFWFLLTVICDQIKYGSTSSPFPLISNIMIEWAKEFSYYCCACCLKVVGMGPQNQSWAEKEPRLRNEDIKTKSVKSILAHSKQARKSDESNATLELYKTAHLDPANRICCSLRHVTVSGPYVNVAQTRGDPLKTIKTLSKSLKSLHHGDANRAASSQAQFIIGRSRAHNDLAVVPMNQQNIFGTDDIVIDETIRQHIVWHAEILGFKDLSLDFRFNQVTFILGQTSLKELFFATLLGLRTIQSGHVILDGIKYTAGELSQARSSIGHLTDRDIVLNELTVLENLQFFGSLRDPNLTQFESESAFLLNLLHLATHRYSSPVNLTHRSARKLALAAAAVGHTKLLLLVEPTLTLRWRPRCQVLNLLKKYKSIRSIIVDTSDIDEAVAFGDRIVLLKRGRVELEGSPERLEKPLGCGYRFIFEPISGSHSNSKHNVKKGAKNQINSASIQMLDKLATDVFKSDKIDHIRQGLRSIYDDIDTKTKSGSSGSARSAQPVTPARHSSTPHDKDEQEDKNHHKRGTDGLRRPTAILKVVHSHNEQSTRALCTMIQMFAHNHAHCGFRMTELTYESLEDVIVKRMARAMYPDLPPDLLLSLSHRTQAFQQHVSRRPLTGDSLPPVSVRRMSDEFVSNNFRSRVCIARLRAILYDRLSSRRELIVLLIMHVLAIVIVGAFLALTRLQLSGTSTWQSHKRGHISPSSSPVLSSNIADELMRQRVHLFLLGSKPSPEADRYLERWLSDTGGGLNRAGYINKTGAQVDSIPDIVSNIMVGSRETLAAVVFVNLNTGEAVVEPEPHAPQALSAAVRLVTEHHSKFVQPSRTHPTINRFGFEQRWQEALRGFQVRRMFYGLAFAISEGLILGALVAAPIRHKSEARAASDFRLSYWLSMLCVDLLLSLALIACYLIIFIVIETNYSMSLLTSIFAIFMIYRLVALPFVYLVSLVARSSVNGFLFIFLVQIFLGWVMAIHMQTYIELSLLADNFQYTLASWIVLIAPLSALIVALVNIQQVHRINQLCPEVPYGLHTESQFSTRNTLLERLMSKVRECLANQKRGISTNVWHMQPLGVMWPLCMIVLAGIIVWTFLILSERILGLFFRRLERTKQSGDPMSSLVRPTGDPTAVSLFKWDREKDRIVSEYIRCMNESRYIKTMATNCLYLRIWLKPMGDQSSLHKRMTTIISPLLALGQPKTDISIELKTTLQLFLRVGTEYSKCKVSSHDIIQAYTKFLQSNPDVAARFAVVNWSREFFYKILLHGHYNTKCTNIV